jgi:hypothetical protein
VGTVVRRAVSGAVPRGPHLCQPYESVFEDDEFAFGMV